jgi:hypothetical protein
VVDLLVEDVVLAVDAVGVDGEQDRDAVPGPGDEKALGRYRKTRLFTSGALTLDLLACTTRRFRSPPSVCRASVP